MKNPIVLNSILALALGAFLAQSPALAGPAVHGTGVVFYTEANPAGPPPIQSTGEEVEGATAKIHRNDKGVTFNIHTVGLNPHHVYTGWVVEVGVSGPPQLLTGRIVGGSGKATFTGRLTVQDPIGSEFHAIIADHGPKDPSSLPDEMRHAVPPFAPDGTLNWTQVAIFMP